MAKKNNKIKNEEEQQQATTVTLFDKFPQPMTAIDFMALIGLPKRNTLFVTKKYGSVNKLTVKEWTDIFLKDRVISKMPKIFAS